MQGHAAPALDAMVGFSRSYLGAFASLVVF